MSQVHLDEQVVIERKTEYSSIVTDPGEQLTAVPPGMAAPINNRYRFELGKGRVRKTGESGYKRTVSCVQRNLASRPALLLESDGDYMLDMFCMGSCLDR